MRAKLLCPFIIAGLFFTAYAEPITFKVSPGEDNLIRFESKAPLETIVGTTNAVSGEITLDPADLTTGIKVVISVDAASLKTGNKIRDSHMRKNHLQTEQFPAIEFKIDAVVLEGGVVDKLPRSFTITGDFKLHGVTRTIQVPVEATYFESGAEKKVHVKGGFEVKLSDYEIARPQFLIMKLDEIQRIQLDFWGVSP